jgi:deoxyribodipyrimidine photolyase-like uncharacterized protein
VSNYDFFARHEKLLAGNMRLAMPLRTLERMDAGKLAIMRKKAKAFLEGKEDLLF